VRRILVAYYSRTGYTRDVAGHVTAALAADVEPLDEAHDRSGPWGFLRCVRDAIQKRAPEILPAAYDPAAYALVVLGTPVWVGGVSSPLRSYIAAHKAQFRRVAFFCTQGGSATQRVFREMAELCGQPPVASLIVTNRQSADRSYSRALDEFAKNVQAAVRADDSGRKAVA
jgi:flavodoxin